MVHTIPEQTLVSLGLLVRFWQGFHEPQMAKRINETLAEPRPARGSEPYLGQTCNLTRPEACTILPLRVLSSSKTLPGFQETAFRPDDSAEKRPRPLVRQVLDEERHHRSLCLIIDG
jgi:hypothetical protein